MSFAPLGIVHVVLIVIRIGIVRYKIFCKIFIVESKLGLLFRNPVSLCFDVETIAILSNIHPPLKLR